MRRTIRPRPVILSSPQAVRRAVRAPRRLPAVPRAVAGLVARTRRPYLLTFDLVAIVLAAYVAVALRLDQVSAAPALPAFPVVVALLVAIRTLTNVRLGLYSRRWGYASVPDLVRIVCAIVLGSIFSALVFYSAATLLHGSSLDSFPRSFWIRELLVTLAVLGGVRFAIRAATDGRPSRGRATHRLPPDPAVRRRPDRRLVAGSALRKPEAGVLPGRFPRRRSVTWPVGSSATCASSAASPRLHDAVARDRRRGAPHHDAGRPGSTIRQVVDAALALRPGCPHRALHDDLLDGTLDAYRVRRVQVEDLLRRTTCTEHAAAVHEIIGDRTVLITGAGGSIGSELARQVFALGPRRLILVDRAESALYLVQRELEAQRGREGRLGELRAHLANVASRAAMDRLIADRATGRHLPRRRLQARADDGGASRPTPFT